MKGIDSIFADDVNAKKNGVKVFIPSLVDQYFLIAAYDAAKALAIMNKIKHHFYEDLETPTQEEKNACFKAAVVELIVKGWDIVEDGERVEFNEKNVKRIFLDEKYERLYNFVLEEAQKIEHYKLKEIDEAKKK